MQKNDNNKWCSSLSSASSRDVAYFERGVMSDTVFVAGWPRSFPACDPTLGGKMSPIMGGKIISIMGGKMSPIMGGKIISIMGGKLAKITVKSIEKWQYNKLINREHDMLRK